MQINKKVWSILAIIFSVTTICLVVLYFMKYINIDYIMISLGLTQLFGGLSQIELSNRVNSKVVRKRNKSVGVFMVLLGIIIFTSASIKVFFYR
ncbi:hypothetical protein ACH36K_09080 [Clostridium sp. MB05]|jgi:hypothetical protein|uniref:hypothetical protein n=1 Tax=Clostridium sp. MB05 TaxID=3376682 RepID=UPI00398250ED